MDFRILDRDGLDIPAWDNLARNGSFFHTVPWADVCIGGISAEAHAVFLCGYDNNCLVAGMPAVITRRFGLKALYSMPDGTYGAPIYAADIDPDMQKEFLQNLAMFLEDGNYSKAVIVDFKNGLSGWNDYPMDRSRHFTHEVSLVNPEEYHPHKKIEYDLRAGRKVESEIINIRSVSQVDEFYRLYRLTETRHGRKHPRHAKRFFESLHNRLNDSGKLYWRGLMADGIMVGAQIHFIHEDTLFNWQTVSDYEKRQYKPSQILLYDAINRTIEGGLKKVNLGASPPEATGLIRYKERWQGAKVDYNILTASSWLRKALGR